jgi:hypothetical protein
MLEEAYGKAKKEKVQVYEWCKHFWDGCVDVSDDPRFCV